MRIWNYELLFYWNEPSLFCFIIHYLALMARKCSKINGIRQYFTDCCWTPIKYIAGWINISSKTLVSILKFIGSRRNNVPIFKFCSYSNLSITFRRQVKNQSDSFRSPSINNQAPLFVCVAIRSLTGNEDSPFCSLVFRCFYFPWYITSIHII